MFRIHEDFWLNGVCSKEFHILNCDTSSVGNSGGSWGYNEPLVFSNSQIHEAVNIKQSKYYYQYTSHEPLTINLTLARDTAYPMDEDDLTKIVHWLYNNGTYQELYFGNVNPQKKIYDVQCINTPNLIYNGLGQGIFTLEFRLKYPYIHSSIISKIYNVNGSKTINIMNEGNLNTPLNLNITKSGTGALSVINHCNNEQTFSFNSAQKSTGILSVNGTVFSGETMDIGNNRYQICTGDESLSTHQVNNDNGTYSIANNTKVDLSAYSNYATATLSFEVNGYVSSQETVTIGNTIYEFTGETGVYSKNDVPVDISQFITKAYHDIIPLDKYHMSNVQITLGQYTYSFEQGTTSDILKVQHGLDLKSDASQYRIINIGLYPEFQASGYVDRRIFHYMKPIEIVDDKHLIIPNVQYVSNDPAYQSITGQTAYTSANNQKINIYNYITASERLMGWDNNGYTFYISANSNLNLKSGMVLEILQGNIVNSLYNSSDISINFPDYVAYTKRKFYVGIYNVERTTWQNNDVYRIDLTAGGTSDPQGVENDDGIHWTLIGQSNSYPYNPKDASVYPPMMHYTDSYDNPNYTYPSNFTFPCTNINLSQTKQVNAVITGVISLANVGTNTTTQGLPLLDFDLSKSNTIKCGNTIRDTMISFAKALSGTGTVGTDYSEGTLPNDQVTAEEIDETDGYQNCRVRLTAKVLGSTGNSIKYTTINKKENYSTDHYLTNGHDCPSSNAVDQLYNAIEQQFILNSNYDIDINRVKPISKANNDIVIRAMIAGSKGNDILVASNTSIADWGNTGTQLNVSLLGGTDPSVSNVVQQIISAINSSQSLYTATIDTDDNTKIIITYNTVGDNNLITNTDAFNLEFNSFQLEGGCTTLQDGEVINIDSNKQNVESSINNTIMSICNNNFPYLVYGNNVIELVGNGTYTISYEYRYR